MNDRLLTIIGIAIGIVTAAFGLWALIAWAVDGHGI